MTSTQFRPTTTDAGIARARELLHAAHATTDQLGDTPRLHPHSRRVTAGLTSREMDVMQLVAQGNTSRQIGYTLFISPRTVERHVRSSMQKLQCKTRAEAVRRLTELASRYSISNNLIAASTTAGGAKILSRVSASVSV